MYIYSDPIGDPIFRPNITEIASKKQDIVSLMSI